MDRTDNQNVESLSSEEEETEVAPKGKKKSPGFECETCGKVYKHNTNLSRHKKCHQARPFFVCLKCNLSYLRKDSLQKHLKKNKCSRSCEVQLTCSQCSKIYTHKSSLNRHMKTHTDEQEVESVDEESSAEEWNSVEDNGMEQVKVVYQEEVESMCEEEVEIVYEMAPKRKERPDDADLGFTDSEDESVVPGTPSKEPIVELFLGSYIFPAL